jgi:hypothetical protein
MSKYTRITLMPTPNQRRYKSALGIPILVISAGALLGLATFVHHERTSQTAPQYVPITPHSQGQVVVTYDQIKNVTNITVGGVNDPNWQALIGNGNGTYRTPSPDPTYGTFIDFFYSFHGSVLNSPPDSIICDVVQSMGGLEDDMPKDAIYFLADGNRGSAKIIASRTGIATGQLPIDLAISIAHAKSVEIEVGDLRFKMTDPQLSGLHDFLKTLGITNE